MIPPLIMIQYTVNHLFRSITFEDFHTANAPHTLIHRVFGIIGKEEWKQTFKTRKLCV